MRKHFVIILSFTIIFIIIFLFIFSSVKDKQSDEKYKEAFIRHYKIFTPSIPDKIDFCGEQAPIDLFYIRESLDREIIVNTYFHSSTLLLFKRAYRWFPVIEPILKEYDIPDDFKYLALIESNLTNVVSPSGAAGFWQFLSGTGKSYDLEINNFIDERYNLEKSTVAACKYLNESYELYQNWTLAAAAFNAGKDRITKAIEAQKVNNYYDLYLNPETSRYIFRILALKEIHNRPTSYGFYLREKDLYPEIPYYEIVVDTPITDLVDFALKMDISYKLLKEFNPWLRSNYLPNPFRKNYTLNIPKKNYLYHEKLIKHLNDDERIFRDTVRINQIK